jgi:hypothetical protein
VVACASQPKLAMQLGPRTRVIVLATGIPAKLVYDTFPGALMLPAIGYYGEKWEEKKAREIQADLQGQGFDLGDCLSKGLVEALVARGATARLVAVPRSGLGNYPKNVPAKDRPFVEPDEGILDSSVMEYGFSSFRDKRIHVTMVAVARVIIGDRNGRWASLAYKPTGMMVLTRSIRVPDIASLPTWKDHDDLKAHIPEAVAALAVVCKEVSTSMVGELWKSGAT